MSEFLFFIIFIMAVLAAIAVVAVELVKLVYRDAGRQKIQRACEEDLLEGIQNGQIQWGDVLEIARQWGVRRGELLVILRHLHRKALTGDSELEGEGKLELVKEFLENLQKQNPFAELPENISLQLAGLAGRSEEIAGDVGRLADSLAETHREKEAQFKRQGLLMFWGLLAGILGIAVGVAGVYFGLNQPPRTVMKVEKIIQEHIVPQQPAFAEPAETGEPAPTPVETDEKAE